MNGKPWVWSVPNGRMKLTQVYSPENDWRAQAMGKPEKVESYQLPLIVSLQLTGDSLTYIIVYLPIKDIRDGVQKQMLIPG